MSDDAVRPLNVSDSARFEAALRRFDEENARDPNTEAAEGVPQPRELLTRGGSPTGCSGSSPTPASRCSWLRVASISADGRFRAPATQ